MTGPAAFVPDDDPHWADTLGPMHIMAAPDDDPGTAWHPTANDGLLPDLSDGDVEVHRAEKEERHDQPDGFEVMAAEDSATTPAGEV